MARILDVNRDRQRIKIDFPYNRELVNLVRTLPERRFDNRQKCWYVPIKHLDYVIQKLDGHHFRFSARLRKYRQQEGGEGRSPAVPDVPDGTLTVSELNRGAQEALRAHFGEEIWVVGELQSFERNLQSRYDHYFFELVERPVKGAPEVAKIRAVLFKRFRHQVEQKLEGSGVELADGAAVRLRGRVDLYLQNGSYQLLVRDIDPTYTVGSIELNRERVFRKLQDKGIAGLNVDRRLPICPLRVGVITSHESDAYNDFIHQLQSSGYGFEVVVHDANVQGANTEPSVLRGLRYFERRASEFDAVVITRGGGSRSELAYFDTEAIGEAVCRHPLKVIAGIGHQRDVSLLDLIGESTKTPTAAADLLISTVETFEESVQELGRRIGEVARGQIEQSRQSLHRRATRLERGVGRRLSRGRQRHQALGIKLAGRTRAALERRRQRLGILWRGVERGAGEVTGQARRSLSRVQRFLGGPRPSANVVRSRRDLEEHVQKLRRLAERQIEDHRQQVEHQADVFHLVDPQRVLERGFALIQGMDGAIRSEREVAPGDSFQVQLADGRFQATRDDSETNDTQSNGDRGE